MYQFFVEDEQIGAQQVRIVGSDVNHIKNVLRMRSGEQVRISNQRGRNLLCSVQELHAEEILLQIERELAGTELDVRLHLFVGMPKGERMETIIEKAVELGVYEIVPVAMKYCVVRLDEKKAEKKVARWQEIARSAAKQSKRSIIPAVRPVMSLAQAAEYAKECELQLVPYENAEGMTATARVLGELKNVRSVGVFIGPEGGIADEEIALLRQQAQEISLGARILRTDTAAITTLSMLMLALELQAAE